MCLFDVSATTCKLKRHNVPHSIKQTWSVKLHHSILGSRHQQIQETLSCKGENIGWWHHLMVWKATSKHGCSCWQLIVLSQLWSRVQTVTNGAGAVGNGIAQFHWKSTEIGKYISVSFLNPHNIPHRINWPEGQCLSWSPQRASVARNKWEHICLQYNSQGNAHVS